MFTKEQIASVCHETNAVYCRATGDFTQPSWDLAPDWQTESAVIDVTFNLENPTALASSSHDSWLAAKEADGWKYGQVKDAVKKEHPCYVPYDQLPKEQQVKDALFKAVVAAMSL